MAKLEVLGVLVLTAAGSLLSPVYCPMCHGVKKLKRLRMMGLTSQIHLHG